MVHEGRVQAWLIKECGVDKDALETRTRDLLSDGYESNNNLPSEFFKTNTFGMNVSYGTSGLFIKWQANECVE